MGIDGDFRNNFCGDCGAQVEKSNKYCNTCGNTLDGRQTINEKIKVNQISENQNNAIPYPISPVQQQLMFNPLYNLYNISNLLEGVKSAYKQKFSSIITLFGLFYIVLSVITFFILNTIINAYELDATSDDLIIDFLTQIVISLTVMLIITIMQFIPNSFLYRIIDNLETDRIETWGDTIRYCVSKWPNYILFGLFNLGLLIGTILLVNIAFLIDILFGIAILFVAYFAFFYILLKLISTPAYIIMDGMSLRQALSTSWNRMNGRLGSYFVASIIIGVFGSVVSSFVDIPLSILLGDIGLIGLFIIPAFGQIFIGPLKSLLIISVYYLTKISEGEIRTSKIFRNLTSYL